MHPRTFALVALALAPALNLAGCLDSPRRASVAGLAADGTTDSAAGDATDGDTRVADTGSVGVDTSRVDLCAGKVCTNTDPCAGAWCNPATGLCEESGPPPGEAPTPFCIDDGSCDDGDPCTDDHCTLGPCPGAPMPFCQHIPRPDCPSCVAGGCDDGVHCTEDICTADGTCAHLPLGPYCVEACSSVGALTSDEAARSYVGQAVKVAGVVDLRRDPVDCNSNDGCSCAAVPTFGPLTLRPTNQEASPLWACEESMCDHRSSCEPVQLGVGYWVWGQPLGFDSLPATEMPVMAAAETLFADGYCLRTDVTGLIGQYSGSWRSDATNAVVPLAASISIDSNGAYSIRLVPGACDDCPSELAVPEPQELPLAVHDGWVELGGTHPRTCPWGGTGGRARLFSQENRLVGSYDDAVDGGADPAGGVVDLSTCGSGVLTLNRLP